MAKKVKYFDMSTISSIQDLKRQYKELIKKFHPDLGGSDAIMAEINNEYDNVFDSVKAGSKFKKDTQANMHDGFREILVKIIHIPDIDIEICGTWIWVGGNTRPYKEQLGKNGAGFHWANGKKMWYWHSPEESGYRRSNTPMEKIREIYGSEKVENQPFVAVN